MPPDETPSVEQRVLLLREQGIERLRLKLEPIELVQLSLLTREELHDAIARSLDDEDEQR